MSSDPGKAPPYFRHTFGEKTDLWEKMCEVRDQEGRELHQVAPE